MKRNRSKQIGARYQHTFLYTHFSKTFKISSSHPYFIKADLKQQQKSNASSPFAISTHTFSPSPQKNPSLPPSLDIQSYLLRFGVLGMFLGSSHTFSVSVFGCLGPVILHVFFAFHKVNNEKKPGCLGYIGDYTTQLCRDYNKPL